MAKFSPILIWIFVIVGLGGLYYVIQGQQFATFTTSGLAFIQYHGNFLPNEVSSDQFSTLVNPARSSTAKLQDYSVLSDSISYSCDYAPPACEANICRGTQYGTDANGCALYRGAKRYSNGCERASTCWDQAGNIGEGSRASYCCGSDSSCLSCLQDSVTCGGWKQQQLNCAQGCWVNIQISKNGQLIKEIPEQTPGTVKKYTSQRNIDYQISEDLRAIFHTNNLFYYSNCQRVEHQYSLDIPRDAFDFNLTTPKLFYFEGQNATAELVISNNWKPVKANLSVLYEIPTAIGSAQKFDSKIIDVPVGTSKVTYDVPTTKTTDIVKLTPKLIGLLPGSDFAGTNNECNPNDPGVDPSASCDYVQIGTVDGETFEVQIVPAPIYIEKPSTGCPINYENSLTAPNFCVKSNLKDLTCYQIGCPILEIGGANVSYECSSAGICVQKVFQQQQCLNDSYCSQNEKCDVGSGLCVDKNIFANIFQCSAASDCPNPCQGKSISCNNNVCEYSGECTTQQITCKEVGCAEGFVCNQERAVCERTVQDNTLFYAGIVLVILILGYFFLRKKRK